MKSETIKWYTPEELMPASGSVLLGVFGVSVEKCRFSSKLMGWVSQGVPIYPPKYWCYAPGGPNES